MKTLLHVLTGVLALCCATDTFAQQAIPNGSFENWARRGPTEAPTGWITTDDIAGVQLGGPLPVSTNTVVKSTDRRGGSFAARLQTQNFLGQVVVPGILLLGSRLNIDDDFPGGIPYTSRPARLQLYYKLSSAAATADSALVRMALTRTVNGNLQVIGSAVQVLAPQASYTLLDVPLTYLLPIVPDTLRMLITSGSVKTPTAGTLLFIDDISLTGTVQAAKNPALEAALNVYPNPSPNGEFQLSSVAQPAVATAPYTISDAAGHVVRTAPAAPLRMATGRPVELRGLPAGVYLLQLQTPEGPLMRKLLLP